MSTNIYMYMPSAILLLYMVISERYRVPTITITVVHINIIGVP